MYYGTYHSTTYYLYVDTIRYGMILYGKSVLPVRTLQKVQYRIVTCKFSTVAGTIYSVEDVEKDALTQNFSILS